MKEDGSCAAKLQPQASVQSSYILLDFFWYVTMRNPSRPNLRVDVDAFASSFAMTRTVRRVSATIDNFFDPGFREIGNFQRILSPCIH